MRLLADLLVRFRKSVLLLALTGILVAGSIGGGVAGSLSNGGFDDPDAEATVAARLLADRFGAGAPHLVMVATAPGSVDDPASVRAGVDLTSRLEAEAGVEEATSYWTLGAPSRLRSADGTRALVFATLSGEQGEILDRSAELVGAYRGRFHGLEVAVGGSGAFFAEVQDTVEGDLARAEAIAFPITLALMIVIFGSVVAALLPLAVGVIAIVGTFLVLQLLTQVTEVSIFALNLTTALGLGLAIDYALFVVSRFREELAAGHEPPEAVRRTVETAGRTVLFSAGTVAVSLSAMLVFDLAFLRSMGYAGIAVVAVAAAGAVIVLPALLAVLGRNVDRLRVRRRSVPDGETGVWHRLATTVMRRPVPIATAAVLVLALLGAPFFGVRLGASDERVLAPSSEARQVGEVLRSEFGSFETSPLSVVLPETGGDEVASYAAELSSLDGVGRVDSAVGTFIRGVLVVRPGPAHTRFAGEAGTYLDVVPSVDPLSERGEALVREVRAAPAPGPALVGGAGANQVDTAASMRGDLPWALGIIGAVTFVVLFMMFGSIVVPAKAVVLNLLSLSAAFGAMVWIFQEGNLSGLLGFTATGSLDITMPILMFCIAFGLSMDYEVFLLSRIKEEYDRSGDNEASVAEGLERTGRIVTAAATLIAVVFVAFATSGVSFIKMMGVGLTLAVLVDAFIVRATLVPAFMRLAGDSNWWAPRFLRPVYRRFGIRESQDHGADRPTVAVATREL